LGTLAIAFAISALTAQRADAVKPSEVLLPDTTKGYVSVADLNLLIERWNETQLGKLIEDPTMRPFVDDLKRQFKKRLADNGTFLGIEWEDLQDVYGGEVSAALVQPWDPSIEQPRIDAAIAAAKAKAKRSGKKPDEIEAAGRKAGERERKILGVERRKKRASVVLVDVTGHLEEADELLKKIEKNQKEKGATKGVATIQGTKVKVFTFPKKEGETEPRKSFYCIREDQLIAVDDEGILAGILARFENEDENVLQNVEAYPAVMASAEAAFGDLTNHLRWFVEPFGCAEVLRAYNTGRERRGTDMLRVLRNQGFTAVQGVGGYVALKTEDHDIRHHTLVYAPAVEREPNDEATTKYDLAARMLEFPNTEKLDPESWIPRGLGMHVNFNWKMSDAFWYAETLVNEIAGDDVFDGVIENIEFDAHGPKINMKNELTDHLGERATLLSDYQLPITPTSERLLAAFEVTDPVAVMKTVNKAMENNPDAKKRIHNGHVIWELVNADTEDPDIKIDGLDGFGFEPADDVKEEEKEETFVPNSAVTVAHGHLLISSHVGYIADVLDPPVSQDTISAAADFQAITDALVRLGSGTDSFRLFTRMDETMRTTYELMRRGKMPESESLIGRLLNRMLAPDDEDELREQEIDASKLPDFDVARRYLGPTGFYVRTVEEGWIISGCLLTKEME
jgi:hypothetical protein